MKKINKSNIIEELQEAKDYFLQLSESNKKLDNAELLKILTKATSSITLENDDVKKKIKINFLIFWINYLLDAKFDQLSKELRISIVTIINSLDLFQLDSFIRNDEIDNPSLLFNINSRKIFDDNMILTNNQLDILTGVLNNDNIIFSAPTSYGKSSIVLNSLFIRMKEKEINNVIIVVPSKALINEYRKSLNKLIKSFNYKVEINENPYIDINNNVQYFHIFTQERVLIFDQINKYKIDYTVFDEIQELLSISKNDNERAIILAKAISIYENNNTPMIMIMPYIQNPEYEFINHFSNLKFIVKKNLLSPTTSNKYLIIKQNDTFKLLDVTLNKGYSENSQEFQLNIENIHHGNSFYDIKYDFYKICSELNVLDQKSLCYCNKSDISSIAKEFQVGKETIKQDNRLQALVNYLKTYVHPNFELISFLEKGIAIHHSDLDTFTKRQIEECFKDQESKLNMIFCTSTLLQGVNLKAENLFFLAPKGQFTNSELDKKNLFGRVGRIGSKLQGNIFKFWVEGQRIRKETIINELNNSSDQYSVNINDIIIDAEKIESDDNLNSYYHDTAIKKKVKTSRKINYALTEIDNFDYFIGKNKSTIVDRKINDLSQEERLNLENKLKLSTREDCGYVLTKLCEIYDWESSKNFDEKYRMTSIEYLTTVFYNNFLGRSIKQGIESIITTGTKSDSKYILTILRKANGDPYPKLLLRKNYRNNPNFVRVYTDKDINLLIYSYIYETQNIIEFRVKKYLQDLYYRLSKSKGNTIKSMEDYLIYSVTNNEKKLGLNKIGLLDSFTIDKLSSIPELFDGNTPNIQKIKEYANNLSDQDPIRYSILDVII